MFPIKETGVRESIEQWAKERSRSCWSGNDHMMLDLCQEVASRHTGVLTDHLNCDWSRLRCIVGIKYTALSKTRYKK